jgi:hypothetical protein
VGFYYLLPTPNQKREHILILCMGRKCSCKEEKNYGWCTCTSVIFFLADYFFFCIKSIVHDFSFSYNFSGVNKFNFFVNLKSIRSFTKSKSFRSCHIEHTLLPTRMLILMSVTRTITKLYIQPSSWRWTFELETCRRHQKFKNWSINLGNVHLVGLYCITVQLYCITV